MAPRRYDAVSFDFGGTLVYLDPVRLVRLLGEHRIRIEPTALLASEERARAVADDSSLVAHRTSDQLWRLFLDALLAGINVPPGSRRRDLVSLIEEENAGNRLWAHVPPEVPALLDRLHATGFVSRSSRMEAGARRAFWRRVAWLIDSRQSSIRSWSGWKSLIRAFSRTLSARPGSPRSARSTSATTTTSMWRAPSKLG